VAAYEGGHGAGAVIVPTLYMHKDIHAVYQHGLKQLPTEVELVYLSVISYCINTYDYVGCFVLLLTIRFHKG
jgi:hypothetical protein